MPSWFSSKGAAPKISEDPSSFLKEPSTLHIPEEPRKHYPRLATPHDAFLSDPGELSPNGPSPSHSPLFHEHPPTSVSIAAGLDVLLDPFDGTVLGKMSLPDPNLTTETIPMGEEITRNEQLWSHLSRVLDLQSDIAKLHMGMEGIIGEHSKAKDKRKATSNLHSFRGQSNHGRKLARELSVVDDEQVRADEGVEVGPEDDDEERKNREREEEFARLADQFEGRKEGINEIMLKLDDLSQALNEFHALQAPQLNFPSSRQNSMAVGSPISSPAMSMDKETTRTFTPMSPLNLNVPTITPTPPRPERILSPSRTMMDSPMSTVEGAFFPKH